MELTIADDNASHLTVALDGSLDAKGTGEITNKFLSQITEAEKNVIVDLSEVTFVASIGIRLFLQAAKQLSEAKYTLVLLKPRNNVESVLTAAGLHVLLPLAKSEDEALRLLQS